jgi:two-component system sensor histidine kinase AlgZ
MNAGARDPTARELSARAASMQETGQSGQLYLPDFCRARAVLAIVIICELTALVLALARNEVALGFWPDLARTSLFLLWIGLFGAGMLCVLRGYLNRQSLAKGSAIALFLTAALVTVISTVAWWFGGGMGWLHDNALAPQDLWTFLLRNVVIALVVTALALRYFYVTHEWRHNVELQARARVHALQARIRPHFLFNSMNTIAALTRSNPARAEEAVQDLADLFRANLSEKRNQIALSEEIDVARTYQRMEQLRLGDRLRVDWKIDSLPQDALVPGLMLQPLLENAIYHGIEPRPDGGVVTVVGEFNKGMITIVVRNPLPAANLTMREGNRLALANIKERMDLMYDDRATVKSGRFDEEYIVTLRFPFQAMPAAREP